MQNIFKGIWQGCGFGPNKGSAAPAAIAPPKLNPKKDRTAIDGHGGIQLDMDKCFQIGYESVSQATCVFMKFLKKIYGPDQPILRQKMCHKWNITIENLLVSDIAKHYPKHHFVTRNKHKNLSSVCLSDEPTWFLDPIHGASNLLHGFPFTVIKLAFFMYSQPQFSIIWNPLLDQCYTARLGFGAYMNVNRLHVSNRTELCDALVMHELRDTDESSMECIEQLAHSAHGLRSLGCTSSNMAMVAQGFADAYFDFDCPSWDMSAPILLVKEAGGVVLDPSLEPFDLMSRRILCASSMELAQELSEVLSRMDSKGSDNNQSEGDEGDENCEKSEISQQDQNHKKAFRAFCGYTQTLADDESALPIHKDQATRDWEKRGEAKISLRNMAALANQNKSQRKIAQHRSIATMTREVLCANAEKLPRQLSVDPVEDEPTPVHMEIKVLEEHMTKKLPHSGYSNRKTAINCKNSLAILPGKDTDDDVISYHGSSTVVRPPAHFPYSMSFSGCPKKIVSNAIEAKERTDKEFKHSTDPNLPGQSSMF